MFSKCKVSSDCISNVYSQQFPLVDVYGAAIRRLRTKKEVLKLQQKALVIQLNDALAPLQTLKEEQAPFNASQIVFFPAIVDLQRFTSVAVLWKFESN